MQIQITNAKGTYDVTKLVPSVKWSGDYQQAARSLDFSLVSSPIDKSVPAVDCPLGAGVRLLEGGTLFDGFIVSRTKSTEASQIDLSCYDRGFYLKRNKASYQFTNLTPEAIASRVASDFGIVCGPIAATGVPITRLFFNITLYDILATVYTLASRVTKKQYHIGFCGAQLCISEKVPAAKTLVIRGGSNLIAASTTESIEKMVNTVAIYDTNGNYVRSAEDAELVKLYGRLQEVLKQTKTDDKTAEAQKLLDSGGVSQKITVDCLGSTSNITGGCAIVQEPYTGLYGLFYIDGDVHEWKRGQYYNKLVLNFKSIMDEKEAGSIPNAGDSGGKADADIEWTRPEKKEE